MSHRASSATRVTVCAEKRNSGQVGRRRRQRQQRVDALTKTTGGGGVTKTESVTRDAYGRALPTWTVLALT